jgi:NADH dehydrogenase
MILLIGGTNYIGRSLIRHLINLDYPVRSLLRPSRRSPDLPHGVSVEVALTSLNDRRGLRAALVGVRTVIYLAESAWEAVPQYQRDQDVDGARNLAEACADAGVKRLVYLSSIGADKGSAYPVLRSAAMAEEHIRSAGIPATILRTSVIYGEGDHFTVPLAMMLATAPLFFPLPENGSTLLQPLWVEDLTASIAWSLDDGQRHNMTYEIGGPEYLSYRQTTSLVMRAAGLVRIFFSTRSPYLRGGAWLIEHILPHPPINATWLDFLAAPRTADLDSLARNFGLQPARMQDSLQYLRQRNWGWELISRQFQRSR